MLISVIMKSPYIVYPQEMDYIYEKPAGLECSVRQTCFDYYGRYAGLSQWTLRAGPAEFDSPYAMRIERYAYDQPWSCTCLSGYILIQPSIPFLSVWCAHRKRCKLILPAFRAWEYSPFYYKIWGKKYLYREGMWSVLALKGNPLLFINHSATSF